MSPTSGGHKDLSPMQAAGGTLPEDVQRLFEDVEDYLVEGLQDENLNATEKRQRDAILIDIKQLKERYHLGFLPGAESNLQKATQEQGGILKQGYLEKRSRDSKIFGSEWQKRWCVLDNMAFYYFANEKSKQPRGMFVIENYHAQMAFHLRKDSRRDCCFELTSPGKRTYEFTAVSSAEAMDWVDQIQFLLKDIKSSVIPCEEVEDDDDDNIKEEAYDDIDSFDSPNVTHHQDTSLDLEKDEDDGQSDDCIYEVLPDDELGLSTSDGREDAGSMEKTGLRRKYVNYYQGLWDCAGGHPDELSFQRGDLIYILSKEYNMYGWWVGELNSMVGIVPKEYLMPAYDVER
ncbi:src kinase-associated phosphoprotein 1 isoform X1 [Podarcis raffonei]|uniref:src kinase-associated phosphoprotein 1 isoform X1 n=1 Tax=Podarcis raffonei TaxID=65483 RepID=UPI002329708C|nr:src kinase-associated phosphoprotein 1 isoform X1 [Podarcis raffonei]XP_053218249.1 src kinase-associated phosphoprotein 1 isoform X1 [Podarcis raffonei]